MRTIRTRAAVELKNVRIITLAVRTNRIAVAVELVIAGRFRTRVAIKSANVRTIRIDEAVVLGSVGRIRTQIRTNRILVEICLRVIGLLGFEF
mgnify:CR=1 FL=1